ncbi:hypothetical protein [Actinoplanes friuliensis]|nr:hypothetical protein [Actinoplanes friuliensis]
MFAALGAVLIVVSVFVRPGRQPGTVFAPNFEVQPEEHRLLVASQERKTMSEVVEVVGRISATWSELDVMIDVVSAEHAVARATFDLAGLLERRERLRRTRDDLQTLPNGGLPASNPAVRSLTAQIDRINRAYSQVDAEISRRIAALEKTAEVGEMFVNEEALRRATQHAEQMLAELDQETLTSRLEPEPSTALADEMDAVLRAYRELIDIPNGVG